MILPLLVTLTILLNASASFLVKAGLRSIPPLDIRALGPSVIRIFTNPYILIGLALLPISFISYSFVLQKMNLSVAYPIVTSLVFATVVTISVIAFGETLTIYKVSGLAVLIFGLWLLTR